MIYDQHGRRIRRGIGFHRPLVIERDPPADIATYACGFELPAEDDDEETDEATDPECADAGSGAG